MATATPPGDLPPESEAIPEIFSPASRPAGKVWSFRDLLLFLAFVPVALISANLLVLGGYTLLKPWMGWQVAWSSLSTNPFFLLILQSVFYGFVLGYVYLLVAINYRQPFWRALGWRHPTAWQALACLLGGTVITAAVTITPPLLPDAGTFPLQRLFDSPAAGYAIGAFAILIAPFMEEVIFRGVLFAIFERQVGVRFAVLSTAVLFAGLHVPEYWAAWNHVLMILLVGVAFSLARGISGSLAPSVFLHVGYNASMMAGVFFETHCFRTLQAVLAP